VPPGLQPLDETAARFQTIQDEMMERIQRAAGLHLSAVKSKLAGPLKLTLGQYFAFAAAHERRHLWQARQVKVLKEFPS
jgi:hypothetical protein